MKTAEEFINLIDYTEPLSDEHEKETYKHNIGIIKQIQLDAFKAGMTRAATICDDNFADYDTDRDGRIIGKAILTDRNNLKELP